MRARDGGEVVLEETRGGKRKKLAWATAAVAIMVIIAFAVVYVNLNSALNSALFQSLNTFDLVSVAYPSVSPDTVDLNITFSLENPTSYTTKVSAIMLSFRVDEKDIGSVNFEPNQDLPPGEENFFYFFRHVTDENILMSFNNQTYNLVIKGKISASVSHFFVGASRSRDIDSIREVNGIS